MSGRITRYEALALLTGAAKRPLDDRHWSHMDREIRLKRLRFRAWHRGTKEADLMVGGFFDTFSADWNDDQIAWYEALMEEQDVDIMGWAIGTIAIPERWQGPMMERLRVLDYVPIEK
jgi:antitoxin CptB